MNVRLEIIKNVFQLYVLELIQKIHKAPVSIPRLLILVELVAIASQLLAMSKVEDVLRLRDGTGSLYGPNLSCLCLFTVVHVDLIATETVESSETVQFEFVQELVDDDVVRFTARAVW